MWEGTTRTAEGEGWKQSNNCRAQEGVDGTSRGWPVPNIELKGRPDWTVWLGPDAGGNPTSSPPSAAEGISRTSLRPHWSTRPLTVGAMPHWV